MTEFETKLNEFVAEFKALQEEEFAFKQKGIATMERFRAWTASNGLPENFTFPDLMVMAIRQSK